MGWVEIWTREGRKVVTDLGRNLVNTLGRKVVRGRVEKWSSQ